MEADRRTWSGRTLILRWPVQTTGITSHYGPRSDPISRRPSFHFGLDMAGNGWEIPFAPVLRGTSFAPQIREGMDNASLSNILGAIRPAILTYQRSLFARRSCHQRQPIGAIEPLAEQQAPIFILSYHKRHHLDPFNFSRRVASLDARALSMVTPF